MTLRQLSQNLEKQNLFIPVGIEKAALHFDISSSVSVINQKYEHLKMWNCKLETSLNQKQPDSNEIIP